MAESRTANTQRERKGDPSGCTSPRPSPEICPRLSAEENSDRKQLHSLPFRPCQHQGMQEGERRQQPCRPRPAPQEDQQPKGKADEKDSGQDPPPQLLYHKQRSTKRAHGSCLAAGRDGHVRRRHLTLPSHAGPRAPLPSLQAQARAAATLTSLRSARALHLPPQDGEGGRHQPSWHE